MTIGTTHYTRVAGEVTSTPHNHSAGAKDNTATTEESSSSSITTKHLKKSKNSSKQMTTQASNKPDGDGQLRRSTSTVSRRLACVVTPKQPSPLPLTTQGTARGNPTHHGTNPVPTLTIPKLRCPTPTHLFPLESHNSRGFPLTTYGHNGVTTFTSERPGHDEKPPPFNHH